MQQYNDEIQLKDILIKLSDYKSFLFTKKLTIFLFSFLFSLLAICIVFTSDTKYNADLTFVVEGDNKAGNLAGVSGIASQFGFDIGGSSSATFSQDNVIELLKSRGVIQNALMQEAKVNDKKDLLIEHYLELNAKEWEHLDDLKDISFHHDISYIHDSIIGVIWKDIIENNLNINMQTDKANIIQLSYVSINQEFAKAFVESLIGEMSMMYISHQTAQANNTLDFLQKRADSVFLELEIAEQDYARIKDINQRIVKASGRLHELQLMRKVEVLNTMYLEIIKNLELSKLTLLNQTPIINIIDKPVLPLEKNNFSIMLAAIFGALLGGFLTICFFIFSKLFKDATLES